jgi:FlgN protein
MSAVTTELPSSTEVAVGLRHGLETEGGLLKDLRGALREQRDALARDDAPALEAIVHQIGRTLLAIRETRRHRSALIAAVTGSSDAPLSAAIGLLRPPEAEPVEALCRELHQAAMAASRELAINQSVLRRAIQTGEQFLQQMLTAPVDGEGAGYPAAASASGLLFNPRA